MLGRYRRHILLYACGQPNDAHGRRLVLRIATVQVGTCTHFMSGGSARPGVAVVMVTRVTWTEIRQHSLSVQEALHSTHIRSPRLYHSRRACRYCTVLEALAHGVTSGKAHAEAWIQRNRSPARAGRSGVSVKKIWWGDNVSADSECILQRGAQATMHLLHLAGRWALVVRAAPRFPHFSRCPKTGER